MHSVAKKLLRCRGFIYRHKIAATFLVVALAFFITQNVYAVDPVELLGASGPINVLMIALALVLQAIAWAVGKLIVLIIGIIIIPVLGYNNFGDSNIINVGWPLVRDIVNMGVIIILLMLAVQTILGMDRAKISQNLPRIFIAVIAVNFSRTITLLIIDAGQVVMFTFVNALREIAAGNFVGLFQINSFMGISSEQFTRAVEQGGLGAVGYLGSAYITLALLLAVLGVLLLMAIIFIYRIVVLWVLVIMSPAAFFMLATKDMFSTGSGRYAEWWGKLVGAVTLGPILTFFLWLGLAAASNGAIAATEKFPEMQSPDSVGIYTEIFETEKLTSLFIGIVLIFTGFQVASQAAGALGGVAATMITEQKGMQGMKMALGAPATVGYRLGRRTAIQAERRYGAGAGISKSLTAQGAQLGAQGGLVGGLAGRAMVGAGGALAGVVGRQEKVARERSKERIGQMSTTQKLAKYEMVSDPTQKTVSTIRQQELDDAGSILEEASLSGEAQKKAKNDFVSRYGKDEGEEHFNKFMHDSMAYTQARVDKGDLELTDAQEKSLLKTQTKHIHLLDDKQKRDVVASKGFDRRNLKADGVRDSVVQEALSKKVSRTIRDKDGTLREMSELEELQRGHGAKDESVRQASLGQGATFADSTEDMIKEAVRNTDSSGTKYLNVKNLKVEDMDAGGGSQGEVITRALIDSDQNLSSMRDAADPAILARFVAEATNLMNDAQSKGDLATVRKAQNAMFLATGDVDHLGVEADGTIPEDRVLNVSQVLKAHTEQVVDMKPIVETAEAADTYNDTTKAISEAINSGIITNLGEHAETATAAELTEIKETLDTLAKACTAEYGRDQDNRNVKDRTLLRYAEQIDRIQSLYGLR